jgi:hypothetical protein
MNYRVPDTLSTWSPPQGGAPPPAYGAPPPYAYAPPTRGRRGPGGCLLGLLAFLLICVVAAGFAVLVARPYVSGRVRDELDRTLSTQVADLPPITVEAAGQFVVTEREINQNIRLYAAAYDPIEDPVVSITTNEIRVDFDLYGTSSAYHGGLTVRGGRVVVVDPEVEGPAGQVLDAEDLAAVLEEQFAAVMTRSNLRPTRVQLRNNEVVITTREVR